MRSVLVIEDQFLESFELECRLKAAGYGVEHAATLDRALALFHDLRRRGELVAVICDNRLIDGAPIAALIHAQIRSEDRAIPFVVYSGFPPHDLPADDPQLKVVRKPFIDEAISFVRRYAPPRDTGPTAPAAISTRDAA